MRHNDAEIEAVIALSRKHDNITRAMVGNESILRGDVSVE